MTKVHKQSQGASMGPIALSGHNFWASKLVALAKEKLLGRSEINSFVRIYRYTLSDGSVYTDFIQGQKETQSGTLVFMALKDKDGNVVEKSCWKERTMQ